MQKHINKGFHLSHRRFEHTKFLNSIYPPPTDLELIDQLARRLHVGLLLYHAGLRGVASRYDWVWRKCKNMFKFRMNVPETMINGQEQRPWGRGYGAHLHCLVNTELQARNRICVYFRLNLPAYNKFDIFPRTPSTPSLLAQKIKPECACQVLLGLNTRLLALGLHQCIE